MIVIFNPHDTITLSDGRQVHPDRAIIHDGHSCWGDAFVSGTTLDSKREEQVVKTAHRLEEFVITLERDITVLPGSWFGDAESDALYFTIDDDEPFNSEELLEVLRSHLGIFEHLAASSFSFYYRRCS